MNASSSNSANITCSDIHYAIAVSPDTSYSCTRIWSHVSILLTFVLLNASSPFVTNLIFLSIVFIFLELRQKNVHHTGGGINKDCRF